MIWVKHVGLYCADMRKDMTVRLVVQMFISRQDRVVWLGDLEVEMDFLPGELFGFAK
jgi:hypothetical protein